MISLVERGARDAFDLLQSITRRTRDMSDAFDKVADDVFAFQRRWWLTTGPRKWGKPSKNTLARDKRAGRDPRMMIDTGGLMAAATRRGAPRQEVRVGRDYVLVGVTDGLAQIHENRGRPVLGTPDRRSVREMTQRVSDYILTGRS